MSRGRPIKSQIRQNIVEILYFMKKAYGYQLYKTYIQIFPKCTQKSIYYHLAKGVQTKEFLVKEIKQEKGEFSWGNSVEKIYYELGENAKPSIPKRVAEFFNDKNSK